LIVQPFEKSVGRANRTKSGTSTAAPFLTSVTAGLRDCTRLSTTLYSLVLVSFSAPSIKTGETPHRANLASALWGCRKWRSFAFAKNAARRAAQELVAAAELHT
jgi:hypothetical protein